MDFLQAEFEVFFLLFQSAPHLIHILKFMYLNGSALCLQMIIEFLHHLKQTYYNLG